MTAEKTRPSGLIAIDREMARQHEDALASFASNQEVAARVAASIRRNGRL
ncbi:MAG: aminotransferase, partial [Mesorhizobium sp.]|nr:aminotransferase [Mesorhizobium sp.]